MTETARRPGDAVAGPALAGCVIAVTADRRFKELANALERRGATVGSMLTQNTSSSFS